MAVICKNITVHRMRKLWPGIAPCFVPMPDESNRLYNRRLARVLAERAAFRAKMQEFGREGARKRWGTDQDDSQPTGRHHGHPNDPPSREAISQGIPNPCHASASASASASAINSFSVDSDESTGEPLRKEAQRPEALRAEARALMPVIRECLYVPDGKPPPGYDDGRDYKLIMDLLQGGESASTLEAAIRGVAMMRDAGELEAWSPPIRRGTKLTTRVLHNTRFGKVQMIEKATEWYFKRNQPNGKGGQPTTLAAVLAGMAHAH
jgi:hypothetical protein